MRIKIFADCADIDAMKMVATKIIVHGFTTNPTLMRKAGVVDYEQFGREAVKLFPYLPVSLEVVADDLLEMQRQALAIASWGKVTYVKIPIMTPQAESCDALINSLSGAGVRVNVTAVMTLDQVYEACLALRADQPSIISVFAGRIADTGVDPIPFMKAARTIIRATRPEAQLLWASPREILNLYQAEEAGCDIITLAPELLVKIQLLDKDLDEFSLETIQMFDHDAKAAGYTIAV